MPKFTDDSLYELTVNACSVGSVRFWWLACLKKQSKIGVCAKADVHVRENLRKTRQMRAETSWMPAQKQGKIFLSRRILEFDRIAKPFPPVRCEVTATQKS